MKKLEAFKQFNVLYAIAKTYTITPDEAFNMAYSTALLTLQRNSMEAVIRKKYASIIRAKAISKK